MRIEFKKVEIHNFMSFSDEIFEFDKHNGLNLICGKNNDIPNSENGSGKSSLCDSLCFSLYGQTKNNLKNNNIHNKYVSGKDTRVVTYFSIEDHNYKIASGFNKYGSPYCEFYEITDNDEIDLTKSTITETRKYVEQEILHCDISIFLRTILLSSDQNYNFFRLKKADKKEFIEKLFDISIFGEMYDLIHRDVLDNDKIILAQQNKLIVLNKQYDEYKERIDKYNKECKEHILMLENKRVSLNEQLSKLKNLNVKINSDEVKKYENAIEIINNAIFEVNLKIQKLNEDNSKLEFSIHKLNSLKDQKQKIIDKHSELLNKLCNDCKKIFSKYYNIDYYLDEISKSIKDIKIHEENIQKNNIQINSYKQKIEDLNQKQDKANFKIQQLTKKFNETNKEIQNIESNIFVVESEINKTKKTTNPYTELFEKNKKDIEIEKKSLDEISKKYVYLKFAENIVSQDTLRKFIISDLVGLLNNKIKMYLTKFGAKYSVKFDSNMDYEFIIDSGNCQYDNFSAGERARLMIAACFAFRDFMYIRNNLSSNILILDEFIDGAIDSLAIESILEILKGFSSNWKQNIYIISHRKSEMKNDIFDNVIQIVKTNNISTINYLEN